jgi:hypothetical protein
VPVLDFDKSSSKGRKSLSMRGGCNKRKRFLEVVARVEDDRKGIIWIPEACSGQGWRRFVLELRSWLAVMDSAPGSSSKGYIPKEKSRGSFQGIEAGRTFAEVLRSPFREVEELGLAKRVRGSTRLRPAGTRDPFRPNPDTTRLHKRVGAPDTTRPVKIHGSPDTTREPV